MNVTDRFAELGVTSILSSPLPNFLGALPNSPENPKLAPWQLLSFSQTLKWGLSEECKKAI